MLVCKTGNISVGASDRATCDVHAGAGMIYWSWTEVIKWLNNEAAKTAELIKVEEKVAHHHTVAQRKGSWRHGESSLQNGRFSRARNNLCIWWYVQAIVIPRNIQIPCMVSVSAWVFKIVTFSCYYLPIIWRSIRIGFPKQVSPIWPLPKTRDFIILGDSSQLKTL